MTLAGDDDVCLRPTPLCSSMAFFPGISQGSCKEKKKKLMGNMDYKKVGIISKFLGNRIHFPFISIPCELFECAKYPTPGHPFPEI